MRQRCSRAKVVENCRYVSVPTGLLILSVHGAVLEKNVTFVMTEQGDLFVTKQSNPLFLPIVMKRHIPSIDDLAQEEDFLQRKREQIQKLSQQERVSKICTDAGFLNVVEIGQYFMTKVTE